VDGVKDIVFVIDTSSSIGFFRFQMVREFVDNVTRNLLLNSPESSVGVILFDNFASIQFTLGTHSSLTTLSPAINPGLLYGRGFRTDTAGALRLLLSTARNGFLGIRNETSNIAIVITDGRSDNRFSTQSAAAALHAANIFDVYAIGYGSADINELNTIASDPHFIYFANFFNQFDIQRLQMNVTDQLCSCKQYCNVHCIFFYLVAINKSYLAVGCHMTGYKLWPTTTMPPITPDQPSCIYLLQLPANKLKAHNIFQIMFLGIRHTYLFHY